MDKKQWEQITDIVDEVLQTDDQSRQTKILEERCLGNKALKKQVINFLKSIEDSTEYWNSLFYTNRLFISDLTENHPAPSDEILDAKRFPFPVNESDIPDQIGPYSLKKRIGIGGMGEVFLASRIDEKFNQNVALKLIRYGINSHDQAFRFEQERVILSSLNHPNIARLLDGGISEDGRSYYVMEFVDGKPLTDYCREHDCTLQQRLRLFKQVCKAVQYAHSNFIVHRDIKSDNLLIDKEGTVKVLDFGIAKMIDSNLDEQTLKQTQAEFRMLSLKNAAPEQLTLDPITTATDVYALGILLYQLLAEAHPFQLENKRFSEAEYIIRNIEPERPSLVSKHFKDFLKGDLDAIVLKALRKKPSERYKSAQSILDDIERYENSLPVSARKESIPYLTKKFIRRHSIPVIFSLVIVLLIAGFTFFYTHRISQEKREAELQAEKAEQVTLFLMDLFEANSPAQTGGEILTMQNMLDYGETEAEKLNDYPDLKARMLEVIGEIYRRLGKYQKSEVLLRQSLTIRQNMYGNNHPETVNTLDKLGLLLINSGDYSAADSVLSTGLDIRETHLHSAGPELAQTLSNLAYATRRLGNSEEAEEMYRRSLVIREEYLGKDNPLTLESMNSLGVVLHNKGKYRETEALFREILERRQKILPPVHPDIAISENSLGALLMNTGNYQEADSLLKEALRMRVKLYGENHPDVALTLNNLAISELDQNKLSQASQYIKEAYRIRLEQLGDQHTSTAITQFVMAELMLKSDLPDSALTLYNQAYHTFFNNLSADHSFTARTMIGIGTAYLAKNEIEIARPYFEEGYKKVVTVHDESSLEYALAGTQYASFLIATHEEEKAREILQTAYHTLQKIENAKSERQETTLALINRIE